MMVAAAVPMVVLTPAVVIMVRVAIRIMIAGTGKSLHDLIAASQGCVNGINSQAQHVSHTGKQVATALRLH